MVAFTIEAADADAIGDEPIWQDRKVVGWVTSGGYAHHAKRSMALGYVPAALAGQTETRGFEIEILGVRRLATLQPQPIFDPDGRRMRS
ncbi:MAG: glycine cleavage T C-terminal barrel domain-containing protein [Aliidongia sp.]